MANNSSNGQVQIDYVAKDFNSVVDDLITFAATNFGPGTPSNRLWTDFNVSSFSRTWLELVAYVSDLIFFYLDNQATEAYLESATLQSSILNIANQFGFVIPTAASAGGVATFTTNGPATIPAGLIVNSASGVPFFTTQAGSIATAGSLDIPVLQGTQVVDSFTAQGIQSETFTLSSNGLVVDTTNIIPTLRSPIVTVNNVTWTKVQSFIESFPTSNNYMTGLQNNGVATIIFGDGLFGRQLNPGDQVKISYRTGGGSIGNIAANTLTALQSSAANVASVTNGADFSGGTDNVTLDQLRSLIPASLSTLERAVTIQDHADLILLNFPQVAKVSASINNLQIGTDINIYVVPTGTTVTEITQNPNLLNSIGSFLNIHKMVTSQYTILNGNDLPLQIKVRIFVNQNASQSVVQSNVIAALTDYFNFNTGTISSNGTGPNFGQEVLLSNVYNVISAVSGIDRFEILELNYRPQVIARSININKLIFADLESLPSSGRFQYFIVSEVVPPNLDGAPIGQYEVFQRETFTVTNISDNSIQDNTADFSVLKSTGTLVGSILKEQGGNIFTPNEFSPGYLILDSNNNIFKILSNSTNYFTIDPNPLNPNGGSFTNGTYFVIRDLRDISAGGTKQSSLLLSNQIVSIQYNNLNTLFVIPGAELLTLGTLGDPFILSTKLTLPLARVNITSVAAFPTIQLDPTLITTLTLGQGSASFPMDEYSNYNPITGVVTVKDANDLSNIVPGDSFIDSNGTTFPILSGVVNTTGSKSFSIKSGVLLVSAFTPNSYNNVSGFLAVPDSVDLSSIVAGDIFVDASGTLYEILGGVSNTLGSKGFDIPTGIPTFPNTHPVNTTIGATIYSGIGQGNGRIVGFGSISQIQPGWVLEDVNGVVGLINSVNYAANQITLDLNSTLPATGEAEVSSKTQIPIPEMGTSINTTSQSDVFILGEYLTDINAKIVPGDLLIDNTGVANEILKVPYVSFDNPNSVAYTYTQTALSTVVFNNTGATAFTYNGTSGLVQYAGSVDLSAVDIGDQFKDGAGTNFTIDAINYSGNALIIAPGQTVNTTPGAGAGGSIRNGSQRGLIQYSGSVDLSKVSILDSFRDSVGNDYTIDTISTASNTLRINSTPGSIGTSPGVDFGGSIRAFNKVQLSPGFTAPSVGTGATLTRRYFSPDNGVTWRVSFNGVNANVGYNNITDLGFEKNTSNPADQFTINITPEVDDITNVDQSQIPTLAVSDINLDLLGGQS